MAVHLMSREGHKHKSHRGGDDHHQRKHGPSNRVRHATHLREAEACAHKRVVGYAHHHRCADARMLALETDLHASCIARLQFKFVQRPRVIHSRRDSVTAGANRRRTELDDLPICLSDGCADDKRRLITRDNCVDGTSRHGVVVVSLLIQGSLLAYLVASCGYAVVDNVRVCKLRLSRRDVDGSDKKFRRCANTLRRVQLIFVEAVYDGLRHVRLVVFFLVYASHGPLIATSPVIGIITFDAVSIVVPQRVVVVVGVVREHHRLFR
mmetsp:Transcript_6729/g.17473  ORF Transcript_6729/g.17473 Transcript_6729/m.17473 type:complete len:266 (-) Transcript_6729:1243-2040(-)